jgi:hypothetical protein
MHLHRLHLSPKLTAACFWTAAFQVLSLRLWLGSTIPIDDRLFEESLVVGWLPILIVAVRRRQSPTITDCISVFAGFPVVLLLFTAFTILCYRFY